MPGTEINEIHVEPNLLTNTNQVNTNLVTDQANLNRASNQSTTSNNQAVVKFLIPLYASLNLDFPAQGQIILPSENHFQVQKLKWDMNLKTSLSTHHK